MPDQLRRLAWRSMIWAAVALAAVGGVLLRELGLLLAQVGADATSGATGGYTADSFSGFRFRDASGTAFAVWWPDEQATRWFHAHLLVDTVVFAPAVYVLIVGFLRLAGVRRRWAAVGLPVAALAADWGENAVAAVRFPSSVGIAGVVLSDVKWVLVGTAMVLGVVALVFAKTGVTVSPTDVSYQPGPSGRTPLPPDLGSLLRPQLWLLLLTSAFVFLVAFPGGGPLDQLPDVIRAQSDRSGLPAEIGPLAALLLLAGTTLAAGIRADVTMRSASLAPFRNGQVLLAAASLGMLLTVIRWVGSGASVTDAGAPFATLIVCVALAVVATVVVRFRDAGPPEPVATRWWRHPLRALGRAWRWFGRALRWPGRAWRWLGWRLHQPTCAPEPVESPDPPARSGGNGVVIGMLPALVLLGGAVGLARATARYEAADLGIRGALSVAATCILLGIVLAVVHLGAQYLARPESPRPVAVVLGVFPVLAVTWAVLLALRPDWADVPRSNGTVALAVAALAAVLGELVRLGRSGRSWTAFTDLKLTGAPWAGLLAVSWLLAGFLSPDPGYHLVRTLPADGATYRYGDLQAAFDTWDREVRRTPECAANGTVPLVLVAAPGGGVRAAQWTAAGLELLSSGPCGAGPLFAISGVSGGSVGSTVWAATRPVSPPGSGAPPADRATRAVAGMAGDRALAGAMAGLLLRDPVAAAAGVGAGGWRDRAAVMEDELLATPDGGLGTPGRPVSWAEVSSRGAWSPVLVLNAQSVTDGCRVLVTNTAQLSTGRPDCQGAPGPGTGTPGSGPAVPGPVPSSVDARSGLVGSPPPCVEAGTGTEAGDGPAARDLPAVTGGLIPARFPVVSPTAGIQQCLPRSAGADPELSTTYAVDGGYGDNSGLGSLLDVAEALRPIIAGAQPGPPIAVHVVLLDNHYRTLSAAPAPKRPRELLAPLDALLNRGPTAGGLEQQADLFLAQQAGATPSRMTVLAPRAGTAVSAPLGWVLSPATNCGLMDQMDDEWTGPDSAALRDVLGIGEGGPAPGRAAALPCG